MTRRSLALAVALACAHSRHVGQSQEGSSAESAPADSARAHARRAPKLPPRQGRPPIAASPDAMLAPGGATKIQDALASRGLFHGQKSGKIDTETSGALKRFQAREGLAATGAPDHETLQRLGLDPKQVFQTNPGGDEVRKGELERKGEK
ncbi:peptidoglycan-binding domain-containing protein [Anaeromyxobacter paludicola]|uniref:Peptidoglycan binding-like domain-containing protein n=1 Tax=Anaeromyxobacter paludicola TaxID=2918171 RepID=A0ABM7X975_9BACT|nr:peptidoglycan-binding domain-containing protein [Anaeromyxobacter paludicola]BDG08399.1 hypothetical protein AMPC_15120 [Anaeromyxobacter paludicola]